MAGYPAGDQELFPGREIGDSFGRGGGVGPGPGGELVDEVVACEDEFFGGDLAGSAEG